MPLTHTDWYVMEGMPVTVPAQFAGFEFVGYPIKDPSNWALMGYPAGKAVVVPPASLNIGMVRVGGDGLSSWDAIEPTQGAYNWTGLDAAVTVHRAAGRRVFYTPNVGVAGYSFYSYGTLGDATAYTGWLARWYNFINALVYRYNDPAGAWRVANPTLGKGLFAIDGWNEMFEGFFTGTNAQRIDVHYRMYQAAKAADAAIEVWSPSANNFQAIGPTFFNTAGSNYPGITGKDCANALSVHWYNYSLPSQTYGDWTNACLTGFGAIQRLRTVLLNAGKPATFPIYVSEAGFDYREPGGSAALTAFNATSSDTRRIHWTRLMMWGAASGFQGWSTYAWERQYTGFPMDDLAGVPKAVSDINNNVSGRTITSARYKPSGVVALTFSDGSTYTV